MKDWIYYYKHKAGWNIRIGKLLIRYTGKWAHHNFYSISVDWILSKEFKLVK